MAARFLLRLMEQKAASAYVNASVCVDRTRSCKDDREAELMRRASLINDKAMEEIQQHIKAGVTEEALSEILHSIYKKRRQ